MNIEQGRLSQKPPGRERSIPGRRSVYVRVIQQERAELFEDLNRNQCDLRTASVNPLIFPPSRSSFTFLFIDNFLFYIGVYLINNVVLVIGVQQSDSVRHIHVFILFHILFPFRWLQNIEQSSLCYTLGPCWLSILNIAVCTCQSQTP